MIFKSLFFRTCIQHSFQLDGDHFFLPPPLFFQDVHARESVLNQTIDKLKKCTARMEVEKTELQEKVHRSVCCRVRCSVMQCGLQSDAVCVAL